MWRLRLVMGLLCALWLLTAALHASPRIETPATEAPASAKKRPPRLPLERAASLDAASPFFSPEACEGVASRRPHAAAHPPRIGSWNIRWFPYGTKDGHDPERRTDLRWLACVIATLEVDVLAVQEMVQDPDGRAALLDLLEDLDRRTGGRWHAELDDCPGSGRQHVGFLYDSARVQVSDARELAALNPGDSACARNLRPGYGIRARFADGRETELVSVHLDSGVTSRDYGNRRRSEARMPAVARSLSARAAAGVFVLGDFNTMGCADCVPAVERDQEVGELHAELEAAGLYRLMLPEAQACSEYERGRPSLLDHVVAFGDAAQHGRLEVYGPCRELACREPPRARRPRAFESLSDHCPLVLELGPK